MIIKFKQENEDAFKINIEKTNIFFIRLHLLRNCKYKGSVNEVQIIVNEVKYVSKILAMEMKCHKLSFEIKTGCIVFRDIKMDSILKSNKLTLCLEVFN